MEANVLSRLESHIADDRFLIFTLISYVTVVAIFANMTTLRSTALGVIATSIYLLVNGVFLGNVFFARENGLLRLMQGILILIMLLGVIGWLIIVLFSLTIPMLALALVIASTASSALKRTVGNQTER